MRNLLNPKWVFLINTVPIVLLFILCIGQYNIIKSLLDENNIQLWTYFGLALALLGLLNFSHAVYLIIKKKDISILYCLLSLCSYITFIYVYVFHLDKIMPSNVPQWMVSENIYIYVGTFLMPTLAYCLLILVSHFTTETKEYKVWTNFLIAICIPVSGYLFSQIILPLWQPIDVDFNIHASLILIIVATIVFLFFLIRGIFILSIKKSAIFQEYQLAWKIPIAIILPLLGLSVNNGNLYRSISLYNSGIFGDFNNPWFYILAVINGILICLPNLNHKQYRLFLFIGRSITFAYTFYFFLVFLPFLPLSVVAIIAIGIGFLLLTPILLFVVHANELSRDYAFLKSFFSKNSIIAISILGFLVIPIAITATYLKDKIVLNETLAYLYSPDYSKQYSIDKHSLQKTLNVVKSHKDDHNDFILGSKIPYLSSYFNWLVLDNLTLSDTKINTIEKIFFGTTSIKIRPENIQSENVKITHIKSKSVYDTSLHTWKSWIDLEITNKNETAWRSEFSTILKLPEGCWISDYYLYVEGKKEFGMLAEKKSAMWVFSNIKNENRDPGILYYLTGNKVVFRVFPFAMDEVRKTGIEFIHKEPVTLTIDDHAVELGNVEETISENVETENVVYIATQQKRSLKPVQRKPYFHFLIDISEDKILQSADFTKRIETILKNNQALAANAQISFVNSYVTTIPLKNNWQENYKSQHFEGGFYLERAIKKTLYDAYKKPTYPVIVVVTDSIENAILDKDFSDFNSTFPESSLFYNLNEDGSLAAHSLIDNPIEPIPNTPISSFDQTVLQYKLQDNTSVYLTNNNEPSIILKKDIFETNETEIKEKNWQSALTMQGNWISQTFHPEISDKEWLHLVRYSFLSKVMTPVTSYLVVENEAQKAILKKKQDQVLSGNKSLDLDDDSQRMSEPSLWIMILLIGIALWYRQSRKRHYNTSTIHKIN
ncbi:MSEP-CTERM sorting domain-containing protein [uncultured Cytophaga sp.]|uniref:MSEP-CTERM sorting domain-containing protein n=1 Tax=uncultured Cytophaga sp. TaxID=160238 RepID=UPI0026377D42|nr:MSEP-CTERM sorting domain-containing protein [uncultured Cytophaga sp.]